VLTDERKRLYERIDRRVDVMMEQGLVAEVQKLKDMGCTRQMVSMQGLGYKEILDYLDGKCSLEEAVYIIKRETRHFAKRQLTWFRREREVLWLDKQQYGYEDGKILADMCRILEEKGIIKELS
jgi:tRNA dimethylallyltransferase